MQTPRVVHELRAEMQTQWQVVSGLHSDLDRQENAMAREKSRVQQLQEVLHDKKVELAEQDPDKDPNQVSKGGYTGSQYSELLVLRKKLEIMVAEAGRERVGREGAEALVAGLREEVGGLQREGQTLAAELAESNESLQEAGLMLQ
ncbi:hypothetical protein T484DRAFT_1764314, partial [Baffinella frigidus]